MLRIAFAVALVLAAATASAQTDPRSNNGGRPLDPELMRSGASGPNDRFSGRVLVGERAPGFDLPDASGGTFRLKQVRGKWTALFFTERRDDLNGLIAYSRTLDSLEVGTVVVCHEKVQTLATWAGHGATHMTTLADERGEIAAVFGLWDTEHGAIRPGLFLLDPTGVVKVALLGQKVGGPSLRGLVQTAVSGL